MNKPYKKEEIDALGIGYYGTEFKTRRKRREKEKETVNNRAGLKRVRAVHFPGFKPSKITLFKQYMKDRLIVHYI